MLADQSDPLTEVDDSFCPSLPVLVVDDELHIREIVRYALELHGFIVFEAADARSALMQVSDDSGAFALIILDLDLPDVSGFEALKRLRRHFIGPIIILSGHSEEPDRVLGLELGADDYMAKPFSPRELAARAKAVCRRSVLPLPATDQIEFGEFVIDRYGHKVLRSGSAVDLSAREFALLEFFALSPGRVWTADDLLARVWDSNGEWQSPTTVREHVYRVRRKIENDPSNPRHIVTVRGSGYRFDD